MKTKRKQQTKHLATASTSRHKQPLIEHLRELKRRAFIVVACVAAGTIAAYAAEHQLIDILLKPSHGQQFIYTSPLGGMNFLLTVCLQLGLIVSTPVIIYNVLAFLKPLMKRTSNRFLAWSAVAATLAACAGLVFGYFVGLPSALHFLLHQFTTVQVRPLLTIQSYVSFVAVYLLGSALMFQLPLIVLFINRIKPLKPQHLLKYERHAIVGSFIVAFVMNPTPNVVDQLLVVIPVLLMYQISIGLLWLVNRHTAEHQRLAKLDTERQERRSELLEKAMRTESTRPSPAITPVESTVQRPAAVQQVTAPVSVQRPPRRSMDIIYVPRRPIAQPYARRLVQ